MMICIKQAFLHILLLALVSAACNRVRENPEILPAELDAHIRYLASDSLKGRFPGTGEDLMAARFIAGEFRKAGLEWITEDGLQAFEVTTDLTCGPNNSLSLNGFSAVLNHDFAPFSFSANDELEAEVVFAGYGFDINTDDLQWSDYQSIEITGKWVMILRGHPETDSSSSVFDNYSTDRDKAMLAKDKGAAGVLFVSPPRFDADDELITLKNREFSVGIPAVHISRSIADRILHKRGSTISGLEQKLSADRKAHSFPAGASVLVEVDLELKKKTTYNVLARLEGSDPELRDSYVVLGAHYDHLGMGGTGSSSRQPDTMAVHYGADDNASGVATMIEVAEKLAGTDPKPANSLLFIAFGAEEMGLLGSKYFIEQSPGLVEKTRMMVNLDMVGRLKDRSLQVGGTGTAAETDSILNLLTAASGLPITRSPEGYGPSDHASFYAKDIPVLFITSGPHADYHTPADNPDQIDLEGMETVAGFTHDLLSTVSNIREPLTFTEAGPKVRPAGRYNRNKVTLGIMPDFMSSDQYEGMRVDAVSPGRPAALGGIKKGDYIIAIEQKPVNNIYDYMYRMGQVEYGQQVIVTVARDNEEIDLLIQL